MWNIIFLKACHKRAHSTGMDILSKFVQQEEYFLGNKVKILVSNWILVGQINEVSTLS